MKTAKEWTQHPSFQQGDNASDRVQIALIQLIQREAWEQGMHDAAAFCPPLIKERIEESIHKIHSPLHRA